MKQLAVLSTPTLLASAGNRDFFHIYNNGSESIFLGYDGKSQGSPDITGWLNVNLVSSGATVTAATGISIATLSAALKPSDIQIGIEIVHAGIPKNVHVSSVVVTPTLITLLPDITFVTLADVGASDAITFSAKLTIDNGWPIPATTWYNLDNDGNRNVFNKEIWAIAVTGPVDVRVQGV
jgi:hypothetical protein